MDDTRAGQLLGDQRRLTIERRIGPGPHYFGNARAVLPATPPAWRAACRLPVIARTAATLRSARNDNESRANPSLPITVFSASTLIALHRTP
jgi:hypothetical protein